MIIETLYQELHKNPILPAIIYNLIMYCQVINSWLFMTCSKVLNKMI